MSRNRSTTIAQIFPARRCVVHTYTATMPTSITVASPATVVAAPLLKINSMYDPYTGVTGTFNVSPSMYTMMSAYYNHYSVIGTRIYVTIRSTSQMNLAAVGATASGTGPGSLYAAVNIPPTRWGCFLDESGGTALQDYPAFEQLRFHRYGHMQQTPFNAPVLRLKLGYSPKKFFGLPWNEPTVGADVGYDPTKLCRLLIYGQPLDMSTVGALGSYMISVTLKMKVIWTAPKDVNVGQGS